MKRYKCIVGFLSSLGSISPFIVNDSFYESKEDDALQQLNSMRDHDGLRPFTELPAGIKFERIL